jgi:thiamine-phosphate pyrophosphorylase
VSTHSLEQAIRAAEEGADYLGIGPIFATSTKAIGHEPVGCAMIRQLRARLELPLIAIGGITLDTISSVIRAGAAGVAVISAIAGAEDVTRATREFLAAILEAEGGP